jgi:hypothetical protein
MANAMERERARDDDNRKSNFQDIYFYRFLVFLASVPVSRFPVSPSLFLPGLDRGGGGGGCGGGGGGSAWLNQFSV